MTANPDRLLNGIEAQIAMSEWIDDASMAQEVIHAEWARTSLLERLRAVTDPIDVSVHGLHIIRGRIVDWASDAIVLRDDRSARWLIPLDRLVRVSGLGSLAVRDEQIAEVRRSRRLTAIMRGWCDEGAPVTAYTVDGGILDGVIVRVGADHVDLVIGSGRHREIVPIAAFSAVRVT